MIAFIGAGLDPSRFWSLTPREISLWIEGAAARIKREQKERAWLAWTTAALGKIEKNFPKLESVLPKEERVFKQVSWEHQLTSMQVWAKAHNEKLLQGSTIDG